MMNKSLSIVGFGLSFALATPLFAQVNPRKAAIQEEISGLQQRIAALESEWEGIRLKEVRDELLAHALPELLPGEELITHSCMALVYDENHEQAKWVAHILVPDVIEGSINRTNDFREDAKIKSGSATEADFFLRIQNADGSTGYDGFGYDRGHLAPSADFRWSALALSESYFYSNMSPQVKELNRGKWADLENYGRAYIVMHPESRLFIATGPVLKPELPVIERGVNQVSIPEYYFKVAYDPVLQQGIGFLMPNTDPPYPVESYSLPINELEAMTGINFLPTLEDVLEERVESNTSPSFFISDLVSGDVEPVYPMQLPPHTFNTIQARIYMDSGSPITVCGTVVGTKKTRNGHVFLNLDKQFPGHIFTVTIWKDDLINFSYDPESLMGKQVLITGKVNDFNGIPSMNISKEKAIKIRE